MPPKGGTGGVPVSAWGAVVPVVVESVAGAAPLSSRMSGFTFSFVVVLVTPASSSLGHVAGPSGACNFSDCNGIDFVPSLFLTLHFAMI